MCSDSYTDMSPYWYTQYSRPTPPPLSPAGYFDPLYPHFPITIHLHSCYIHPIMSSRYPRPVVSPRECGVKLLFWGPNVTHFLPYQDVCQFHCVWCVLVVENFSQLHIPCQSPPTCNIHATAPPWLYNGDSSPAYPDWHRLGTRH